MEYRYPKIFWRPSSGLASWFFPESHLRTAQVEGGQGQGIGEPAGQGLLVAEPVDVGGAGAPVSLGEDDNSIGIEAIPMIEKSIAQETKAI
jgi:hypothetical protein